MHLLFALLTLALSLPGGAAQTDFFIAPNGNDPWTGKIAAPHSARTDVTFAAAPRAFHVNKIAPPAANRCSSVRNLDPVSNFLTCAPWQGPCMNEDKTGTATVDPGFGKTGRPQDFLLKKNPIPGSLASVLGALGHKKSL